MSLHPPGLASRTSKVASDLESAVWQHPLRSPPADIEKHVTNACRPHGIPLEDVLRELDDETLILCIRCDAFTKQAFDELFCRLYPVFILWFKRWTRNEDAAFVLAHEMYLTLCQNHLGGYDPRDPQANLLPFLYTAAYHLFVQKHARGRKLPQLPEEYDAGDRPRAGESPEERELLERIDRRPEPDRTVMRMTIDGHSANEIAVAVGCTVRDVFQTRWRTRRLLVGKVLDLALPPAKRGRPRKDPDGR